MGGNNNENNIFMSSDWFREFIIGAYNQAPNMYNLILNNKEVLTLEDFKNFLLFYIYGSLSSENPFQDVFEHIYNLYKRGLTPLDAINDPTTLGWLNDLIQGCSNEHPETLKGALISINSAIDEGLDADTFLKMKKQELGID